jgi:hypothetical protein
VTDVVVPLDVAQKLLDIATESLDFGSGFLDDEEVEALRAFATLIDADPWAATPANHRPKYCPGHTWHAPEPTVWNRGTKRVCTTCQLREWTTP